MSASRKKRMTHKLTSPWTTGGGVLGNLSSPQLKEIDNISTPPEGGVKRRKLRKNVLSDDDPLSKSQGVRSSFPPNQHRKRIRQEDKHDDDDEVEAYLNKKKLNGPESTIRTEGTCFTIPRKVGDKKPQSSQDEANRYFTDTRSEKPPSKSSMFARRMTHIQKNQAKSYRKSTGENNVVDLLEFDEPDNDIHDTQAIDEKLPAQLTPSSKVKDLELLSTDCPTFASTAAVCSSPDPDDVELIEVRPKQHHTFHSDSQHEMKDKSNSLFCHLGEGTRKATKRPAPTLFDQSPTRSERNVKSICQSPDSSSSGQQACDELQRVLRNIKSHSVQSHSVADEVLEKSIAQSQSHEFKLTKVNQTKMEDSACAISSKRDDFNSSSRDRLLSPFSNKPSNKTIPAKRKKKMKGKSLDCTSTRDVQNFFKADKVENSVSNFGKETQKAPIEQEDPLMDSGDDKPGLPGCTKFKRNFKKNFVTKAGLSKRKPSNDAANPIEIPDSEDEKSVSSPPPKVSMENKQYSSERIGKALDVARVTVGSQYSHRDCKLELKRKHMVLSYMYKDFMPQDRKDTAYQKFAISFADIELFKYCQSRDDLVLVILRVKPTVENSLADFRSKYAQDLNEGNAIEHSQKGYIVLELRSKDNLNELLNWMHEKNELLPFLTGNDGMQWIECKAYAEIMLERLDSETKEREHSVSSSRKQRRSDRIGNKGKRATNKIMVVFPFGAEEEEIDQAADGLCEAQKAVLEGRRSPDGSLRSESPQLENNDMQEEAADQNVDSTTVAFQALSTKSSASEESRDNSSREELQIRAVTSDDGEENTLDENKDSKNLEVKDEKKNHKGRAHYLTIRQEDVDRLDQGEFLNDTLIDFWMQWLMRKEDKVNSPVHVFTSHFYTTLSEDGVPAVESWTAKKNIDIFKKKFIFIPINKSLHWSLCVVVNPEYIVKTQQRRIHGSDDQEEEEEATPVSCILFLDSLKAHQKNLVAKNVRRWLNSEWKRIKKENLEENLFTNKTMRVISPRIPYQDNSWDCGVFVCRYAFALFMMRHTTSLTFGQMEDNFQEAISEHEMFDFGMDDIRRLRDEMKTLLTNLSVVYHKWNEATMAKEKRVREEMKQSESDAEKESDMSPIPDETAAAAATTTRLEENSLTKDHMDDNLCSETELMGSESSGPVIL